MLITKKKKTKTKNKKTKTYTFNVFLIGHPANNFITFSFTFFVRKNKFPFYQLGSW